MRDRFINATKEPFGNRFLVDCAGDGFTNAFVIEGWKIRVELHIAHTFGQNGQWLGIGGSFDLSREIGIKADGKVSGARLEIGDTGGRIRNRTEFSSFECALFAPIVVIAFQLNRNTALPVRKLIWARADRGCIESIVALGFNDLLRNDGQFDELGKKCRISAVGLHRDFVIACGFGRYDLIELTKLRACEGWVDDAIDAECNVFCGQRRPVMKFHV